MVSREALHTIIDQLPEDDEPETEEEAAAVAEARLELGRGERFTLEEIRREFGI